MTNVPKIVRDRLKAAPPVEHPDANLLAAFAESSLPGRERATILDHLSRCGDCREVVSLALPATEAVQPTLSPKPTSWLTWPALRWGVVAAGVVAIASFGVFRYQHANRMEAVALKTASTEAKNEIPLPPASSPTSDKPTTHAAYPAASALGASSHERMQQPGAPAEAKGTLLANPTAGGPLLTRQPQFVTRPSASGARLSRFDRPESSSSKDLRVPAVNESVELGGANVQTEIAQNQPVSAQALDLTEPAVAKSKNAEAPQSGYAGAAASAAPTPNPPAGLVTSEPGERQAKVIQAPARWAISGTGALERSLDKGQTWQDVNVAAGDTAPSRFSFAQETVSAQEVSKQTSNKQASKKNGAVPATFRTVTSNGPDVWAGGSQGALYHSLDNGDHWTRVVPTASGTSLSGDVVALDFPDMQHGKVTTSTPEVWTTPDDGLTWQKQ